MKCTSPLCKAELNSVHMTKKGTLTPDIQFLDLNKYENGEYDHLIGCNNLYKRIYPLNCGQCTPCRLNYASDKATQMMCETSMHPEEECWFLTITYNDEHLPHNKVRMKTDRKGYTGWKQIVGISLDQKNAEAFWKRLSFRYGSGIKKVYCGEYGSETYRPHGHAIVWGLKLDVTRLKKWTVNKWGDPIWRCEELEELWHDGHLQTPKKRKGQCMGNILVGRVTWNTCSYVARYTLKKAIQATNNEEYNKWYKAQAKRPEYIIWSNGVGKEYYEQNKDKIYISDSLVTFNKKGSLTVKPPKSYDRRLKEVDPKLYQSIKEKRTKQAIYLNQELQYNSPFSPEERRAMAEARMKQIMQDFREKEI